jgi:hypothetical protein
MIGGAGGEDQTGGWHSITSHYSPATDWTIFQKSKPMSLIEMTALGSRSNRRMFFSVLSNKVG